MSKREAELEAWDATREALLASSRGLVRMAGSLIRDWHRGIVDVADWEALDAAALAILTSTDAAPGFRTAGFVQQALGEYAEARLLWDLGGGRHEPTGLLARLPADALLLGAADAIGELRRRLLTQLLAGDDQGASTTFDQMESLYDLLSHADPPEALVGLRPKRDQARGILEKTRGDLVTAKKTKDLERRMDGLASLLDEAEGVKVKKAKKPASDDLDLDSAWSKKRSS